MERGKSRARNVRGERKLEHETPSKEEEAKAPEIERYWRESAMRQCVRVCVCVYVCVCVRVCTYACVSLCVGQMEAIG
ncbi:hypothetical protein AN642_00655 [Epulopiscium sp. SCG-B10WGA-EpuloA2]|nr:hypothetical protein AN642_00655 [Epulopiscium sp. SCG-B10WGA-EpuloA2]